MESEEMALMNLFSGQQRRKRHKEWTYGQGGRRGGEGEMYGEKNTEIYSIMCKTQKTGICCMTQGTQTGALRQAEGWGGPEGRRHGCTYG